MTLLYRELVAHGDGSGEDMAARFSNEPDTHMSSLGLFLTGDTYIGKHGYSLRLKGLDAGFNDRSYERAIVMHGAPYVSRAFIRSRGRLGRSWGCPALREGIARQMIDRVRGTRPAVLLLPRIRAGSGLPGSSATARRSTKSERPVSPGRGPSSRPAQ